MSALPKFRLLDGQFPQLSKLWQTQSDESGQPEELSGAAEEQANADKKQQSKVKNLQMQTKNKLVANHRGIDSFYGFDGLALQAVQFFCGGLQVGVGGFGILGHVDVGQRIVGELFDQRLNVGDRHDAGLALPGGGFLDIPVGMAHGVEEAVDTAVLQHAGRVGGLDAFGLEVFFDIDAGGFENVNGVLAVAGAGVAGLPSEKSNTLSSPYFSFNSFPSTNIARIAEFPCNAFSIFFETILLLL